MQFQRLLDLRKQTSFCLC